VEEADEAEEAEDAGVAEGMRASVGVAERPLGVCVAAFAAVAPSAAADAAPDDARCPPAAAVPGPFAPTVPPVPKAAQPAVSVMTPSSTAAVVSAPDHRARRRLPFRPNITSVLPACIRSVPETRGGAGG
jgi:hypothetical protein